MWFAFAKALPRPESALITATISLSDWPRIASIIHSRAMVVAPIKPQPMRFPTTPPQVAENLALMASYRLLTAKNVLTRVLERSNTDVNMALSINTVNNAARIHDDAKQDPEAPVRHDNRRGKRCRSLEIHRLSGSSEQSPNCARNSGAGAQKRRRAWLCVQPARRRSAAGIVEHD